MSDDPKATESSLENSALSYSSVKILLLGDTKVGKTGLLFRFDQDVFSDVFQATIGVDFRTKIVNISDNIRIRLLLWDTAGLERFRTLMKSYLRHGKGIILVYDVTEFKTFNNIRDWIKIIKVYGEKNVNVILVGNKIDKEAERKVDRVQGEKLAAELNIPFMETSAKTGQNVEDLFMKIADWEGLGFLTSKLECLNQIFLCGVHVHEEREEKKEKVLREELIVEDSLLQRAKNVLFSPALDAERKDPYLKQLLKSVHNAELFLTEEIFPFLFA